MFHMLHILLYNFFSFLPLSMLIWSYSSIFIAAVIKHTFNKGVSVTEYHEIRGSSKKYLNVSSINRMCFKCCEYRFSLMAIKYTWCLAVIKSLFSYKSVMNRFLHHDINGIIDFKVKKLLTASSQGKKWFLWQESISFSYIHCCRDLLPLYG